MDALEGPYVAEKLTTQTHSSGYLQSNFFRLMVAMTRDEPDVEEIEQIISVDATLTYGLLRMANSCYYALRHRVTSVRQAIMTMGLSELRQWVYLLSASNAENQMEEGAEEFLRMSSVSYTHLDVYKRQELLGEVGMGVLMKAIPQINAFVINIELKVIIGLLLFFLLLTPINEFLLELESGMLSELGRILRLIGGA